MWSQLHYTSALLAGVFACSANDTFWPRSYELAEGATVRIETDATTYRPGDPVGIRVENDSDIQYIWNPCHRTLERAVDNGWAAADEGDRVCTDEGWLLEPGGRTDATTALAAELESGKYRLRYRFGRPEGDSYTFDDQVSNAFAVAR